MIGYGLNKAFFVHHYKRWCMLLVFIFFINLGKAQTYTLTHEIDYHTENQNMWGPNGDPFNLDFDYELFSIAWDTGFAAGQMTEILGEQFGVALEASTWGEIASHFSMHGFTTGWVDVDYPATVHLTFPEDYTFAPGEIITINSNYEVRDGWRLDTHYPHAGVTTLDLDFGFGADMDVIVCAMNCDTIDVFPDIDIPTDSITIFHLNGYTGETVYPCFDENGDFQFCHDSVLPIEIPDYWDIGLTGEITLPYVETEDYLGPDKCLYAQGDSSYLFLNLDILQFLSAIAGLIPPPQGPAIEQAIEFMNGTYTIPIAGDVEATIEYSLLTAEMDISSTQQQDFTFCPTIWANLDFPTALNYTVTDPDSGFVIDQGSSDLISFPVDNDLNIQYPCHDHPQMPVGISYTLTNDFTNHTWDSIAFEVTITALWFHFHLPTMMTLPPTEMPDFVLDLPGDSEAGIPDIYAESPSFPIPETPEPDMGEMETFDIEYEIGPLIDFSLPLGHIPFTWYHNTWNLGGFNTDTVVEGTQLVPTEELYCEISGNDVLCFGDSTGLLTVEAFYGTTPYTYQYSNGVVNEHNQTTDQINVTSGHYVVTVTDGFGCEAYDSLTVIDINTPITINLQAMDVLCTGENTGAIEANINGGSPPYAYEWQPSGQTVEDPQGIYAGMHYLTVTDDIGCTENDSVFVDEPDSAIYITYLKQDVLCYGGNSAWIGITATGGTPPYQYYWSNSLSIEDLTNIPAGVYTVTVTDANGCEETETINIYEPDELTTEISKTDVSCYGLTDGTIDLTVEGGVEPYTYEWSTGDSIEDLNNLPAGDYLVTVTDANGCFTFDNTIITEPFAPLEIIDTNITDVACHGENTGIIDIEPGGGTPQYTYQWDNGETAQDNYNLPEGTYTVTLIDAHGCTEEGTFYVGEPDAPLEIHTIEQINVLCYGENSASINIDVTGGTPEYSYNWSNGEHTQDIENIYGGNYSVTVIDYNLCVDTANFFIKQPEELKSWPGNDQNICYGMQAEVRVSLADGGTPDYTYTWSNGDFGRTIYPTPTQDTEYQYTVTDYNGCTSFGEVSVFVEDSLTLDLFSESGRVCEGESALINANITGGGLSAPYSLIVNDTVEVTPPFYADTDSSLIVEAGIYDRCGFAFVTDTIMLNVYPLPPIEFNAYPTVGCSPLEVHFIETSPHVGQTYKWQFDIGDDENVSFQKNAVHTFYNDYIYDVRLTITSPEGCISDTVIPDYITVFAKPTARFTPMPREVTLTNPVINFENYSSEAINYNWDFDNGNTSTEYAPTEAFYNPGDYDIRLIVETEHACKDTCVEKVFVSSDYAFYAPDAFTPDHDGLNEAFRVFAYGISPAGFKMYIYDRWGELVFQSNEINKGWNGRIKENTYAEPGVYTWMVVMKDQFGNEFIKTGSVTLIR